MRLFVYALILLWGLASAAQAHDLPQPDDPFGAVATAQHADHAEHDPAPHTPLHGDATEGTLRLYLDADFTNKTEVGQSIRLGLSTALRHARHMGFDTPLEIVMRDQRGYPRRSADTIRIAQGDPRALALFGGMESPNYLINGPLVRSGDLPVLLPWSAAADITRRSVGNDNNFFRLSIDDTNVGPFLTQEAMGRGCQRVAILLVANPWGQSTARLLNRSLAGAGIFHVARLSVPMRAGASAMEDAAAEIIAAEADCLMLVLGPTEGVHLLNALAAYDSPPQVFGHWGLLGNNLPERVPHRLREKLGLRVLQTCGLAIERMGSSVLREALDHAREIDPWITSLSSVPAPAGFVHGHDLGMVLVAALVQAQTTDLWHHGPTGRRRALHDALEHLDAQVTGILKTYDHPFGVVDRLNLDGHEALNADDLCLARFDALGRLTDDSIGSGPRTRRVQ